MAPAGNLDLAALSLDERTRGALEAFEMAVRPFGLAANGHDGQQVRERSLRLLEKDCKALVTAAEALVAAVAYLVECPVLVMLLQKLPRLLCRQALMIGLADVTPELVDRECLKTQVQTMQQQQLESTTRYLQELGAARANLRRMAALGKMESPSVPSKSPSITSVLSRAGTRDGLQQSDAGEQRRPSLLVSPADAAPAADGGTMSRSSSIVAARRKSRKSITITTAGTAAFAAAAFRQQADQLPEVGPEFSEVHNYMWDAVDHLDQGLQLIVCKVIAEKLKCFKTEAEATCLAELRGLCRRMESFMQGTAAEEHDRNMKEVRKQLEAKDLELKAHLESFQATVAAGEETQRSFLKMRAEQEKLRDSMQRQLLELQGKLELAHEAREELAQQLSVVKEGEQAAQKERATFHNARKKLLQAPNKGGPGANLQDFFTQLLPQFGMHLMKELKDTSIHQQLQALVESLQRDWSAAKKKQESLVARVEGLTQELAVSQHQVQQSDREKATVDAENLVLRRRVAQADRDLVQMQSDLQIEKAPAFLSLREDYEVLHCEYDELLKKLQDQQTEMSRKDQEKAQLLGRVEEKEQMLLRMEDQLEEVAASQLHASEVAQLQADLKKMKRECEALSDANVALKSSLAAVQDQKTVLEQHGEEAEDIVTSLAEVSLIQEMGRAREEPRERLQRTRSWAHLERPPPQAVRRCRSEPSGFCFAAARHEPARLGVTSSVTLKCYDFSEITEVVQELIPLRSQHRGASPATPPPTRFARRPVSRFGTASSCETPTTPFRRSAEGPSFLDPGWTPPLRGLLDPNEKEAVQERVQRPVPKVLKARAKSPAPARATPRRINPRPCPRVALSLLPTVRPKSARPKVLVPFGSTVERPRSCLGGAKGSAAA